MAKGDGFHVEEADVHLGLDVYPLPDLEGTSSVTARHMGQPKAPHLPLPPPAGGVRPHGETQGAGS